jgi:COP9 signalosome complex subunit 2
MLRRYTELLAYVAKSAVTRNECTSAINAVLELIAVGAGPDTVSKVYEITLSTLKASANSERLWFSTLVRYGKALLRTNDYGQLAAVVRDLHASCHLSDGSDDPTKGTYLLEVYALEIQV